MQLGAPTDFPIPSGYVVPPNNPTQVAPDSSYHLTDQFGEPIRGPGGLVTVYNGVSYIQGVPVDQETLQEIQGGNVAPSASIAGHWYDPVTGEDMGTTEDMMRKRAAYLAGQQYTAFDNVMQAGVIAVIAWAGGAAFAGEAGAAGAEGVTADAGFTGADLAAPVADASPFTAPGVTDIGASELGAPVESLPSADLPMPEQLSGPGTEPYQSKLPVDFPQTITPAARQTLIETLASQTGSVSGAIATVNRLYTAVRGGRPGASGTPAPVLYQRTGNAPAPAGGADTGGLGANVTPMLKQLAVPGIALIVALLSK